MNSVSIKQIIAGIYIVTFCVFATKGLGFIGWEALFTKYQEYAIILVPLLILVLFFNRIDWKKIPLKRLVWFLVIMPLVSCLSKYILLNESVFSVLYPVYLSLAFLVFFALWALKINEKCIIYSLGFVALVTSFIQIYQHVTGIVLFDYFSFFYGNEEIRNDMTRLYVGSPYIQLICLMFVVDKLKYKISISFIVLALLLLVSIYLYLTRQILAITMITVVYAFFCRNWSNAYKYKNGNKIHFILLGLVFLYFIYANWDVFLKSFIEQTKGDDTFYIRFKSIDFFFNQTFTNLFGTLFGFGHSHYEERWTSLGLYASDAGIAGDMYHYGIGWALAYFYTIHRLLFRQKKKIPFYAWLYIFATLFNSIFALPYHAYGEAFIWACLLYICSIHISNEQKVLITDNR